MPRLTDDAPMLLEERPFAFAAGWLYEIKFDGCRLMAMIDGGRVELRTRGAANATAWFPEVVDGLAGLKGRPFVFAGRPRLMGAARAAPGRTPAAQRESADAPGSTKRDPARVDTIPPAR